MKSTRMLRPKSLHGPGGKLPVGKTFFYSNLVQHEGGDEFVPGTKVRRLRLVKLGKRAVAAFEEEVDELIAGLSAERDTAPPLVCARPKAVSGGGQ
jgi:hypothetical protein